MANFYGSLIGFGAGGVGFTGMAIDESAQTGVTFATDGDYKVVTFAQDGDFIVTTLGHGEIEYLVLAGGGGGPSTYYGGGGGGG